MLKGFIMNEKIKLLELIFFHVVAAYVAYTWTIAFHELLGW